MELAVFCHCLTTPRLREKLISVTHIPKKKVFTSSKTNRNVFDLFLFFNDKRTRAKTIYREKTKKKTGCFTA
jgi:hypothetical protein